MSRKIITQLGIVLFVQFAAINLSASASEHEASEPEAPKQDKKEEKAAKPDAHDTEASSPAAKKKGADEHGGGGGEHGGAEVERIGAIYVPFKPAFVVNYGGAGRLRYIKTDISVRVQDSKTATAVQRHMPYLRNNIVMLLSAQTEENVSSQEGKEALRKAALEKVRELILAEEKLEGIIDLYFTAFLVQH